MVWTYGYTVTIDSTKIDSTLSNFPVAIALDGTNHSEFFTVLDAYSKRKKVAVFEDGDQWRGNQCYAEIEHFDDSGLKAVYHVKVTSVSSSSDTVLYFYFDDSQSDNTTYIGDTGDAAAQSVWNSNFKGVWHLAQDPTGGAGCILDSCSSPANGTPGGGMTAGDLVDGQIGKALDFDGNDEIAFGNNSKLQEIDDLTIEAVAYCTTYGGNSEGRIVDVTNTMWLGVDGNASLNALKFVRLTGLASGIWHAGTDSYPTGATYKYTSVEWDRVDWDDGEPTFRIDATTPSTTETNDPTGWLNDDGTFYIGNTSGGGRGWVGRIAEVRVSDTFRGAAWSKATYYTLTDQLISSYEYDTYEASLGYFVKSIEQQSFDGMGGSYGPVALTKGQDWQECVPFMTFAASNEIAWYRMVPYVHMTSSGAMYERGNIIGGSDVSCYIVEFEPAYINVQQMSWTCSSDDTDNGVTGSVNITAVDTSKAFIVPNWQGANFGEIFQDHQWMIWFESSTKLRAQRGTNVGDSNSKAVVVEAKDWWIWDVAHLDFTISSGNTEALVNIPQDAPWTRQSDNTFIITTFKCNNNSNNPDDSQVTSDFYNGKIRVRRGSTSGTITGKLQLVTSPFFEVQRGQIDFGTGDTDKTATINSVKTTNSIIWGTAQHGSRTLGDTDENQSFARLQLQDDTTVAGDKVNSGLATDGAFQVIEFVGTSPGLGTTTTTTTTTTSTFPYLDWVVPDEDIATPYQFTEYFEEDTYWTPGTGMNYSFYDWDWESYTLDVQPSDWTRRDTYGESGPPPAPPYFHVESKATPLDPPYDDRVLKIRSGNAWLMGCTPDDPGTLLDTETVALLTQNTTNGNGGALLHARLQGAPQYRTFYKAELYNTNKFRIQKWVGGTPYFIAEITKSYSVDTWYWVKFQVSGTNPVALKAKFWEYGTSEPGWDIDTTDSAANRIQTAGYHGPSDYSNAGFGPSPYTDTDVAYYSVSEDLSGGQYYYVSGSDGYLDIAGSWADGYRPTKIRLTGTHDVAGTWTVELHDQSDNTIATVVFPESGSEQTVEADITWQGSGSSYDIKELYLASATDGQIADIEFYEPMPTWVKEGVETSIKYLGLDNTVFYNFPNDEDGIYGIDGAVEWLGFEVPDFAGPASRLRVAVRGKNAFDDGVDIEVWNKNTRLGHADIASFGHFYGNRRSDWVDIEHHANELTDLKLKLTAVGDQVHTWISELQIEFDYEPTSTFTTTTTTTTSPGMVRSVEYTEVTIGTAESTKEKALTKGQNPNNCVPFVGLACYWQDSLDWNDMGWAVDILSGPPRIKCLRSYDAAVNGDHVVGAHVIEFNSEMVKVQKLTWTAGASVASGTIPIPESVDTSKAFIYVPGVKRTDAGYNQWRIGAVEFWFSSSSLVGWQIGQARGTMQESYVYIIEALDDEFSVQTGTLSLIGSGVISDEDTISSVDLERSIVISSHRCFSGAESEPAWFMPDVFLKDSVTVRAERYEGVTNEDISQIRYQVITFRDDVAWVQHATLTYDDYPNKDQVATATIGPVNLHKTAIISPNYLGMFKHDDNTNGVGASAIGALHKFELTNKTTVETRRVWGTPSGDEDLRTAVSHLQVVNFDQLYQTTTSTTTTTTTTTVPEVPTESTTTTSSSTTTTTTTTTSTTLPDWIPDLTFDYEVDVLVDVPSDSLLQQRVGFSVEGEMRPMGWKWDEMIWSKDQHRHDVVLPTLYDPDISTIPSSSWQSGIGHNLDLKIHEIIEDPGLGHPWRPLIRPGHYFIGPENFHLFSPNYVTRFGSSETTGGLSKIDLSYMPKQGAPMLVAFMHRDDDGATRDIDHFRKRVRFTGKTTITQDASGNLVSRQEEVHLDDDGNVVNYNIKNLPTNPEQRGLEYVLITRPEAYVKEYLPISVGKGEAKLISFNLTSVPVDGPPLDFTNDDIFQVYVEDQVPVNEGEYSVGYSGSTTIPEGQVQVVTSDRDQLPGYVTYWSNYPATIMFNNYYVRRIGFSEWTDAPPGYNDTEPGIEFVETADYLGESSAQPNQVFYLSYFPVVDFTTLQVFVYDPRNEVVTEWTRVDDIEAAGPDDEVFTISPDGGFILFGDGKAGKIPHIHAYIAACYDYVPYVQYMPDEEWRLIEPTEVNLQPLYNSTHRGFVYLSHKELSVDSLLLQTNRSRVPDRAETYGPISAGNDYALLTCTAFDKDGGSVPEVDITWTLDPSMGYINGASPLYTRVQTTTDSSGKTRVVYTPVRTAGDMGTTVYLFDGLGNPLDNIKTTNIANDTLELSEFVEADVEDIYVFMVLDDDPLQPYDPYTRTGGRKVILYRYDETTGDYELVRPSSVINKDSIVFDYSLPTPSTYENLVQYDVITDRIIEARATTINPVTGLLIESNPIKFYLDIPESQKGVYTLPTATDRTGSTLDSAVYLTIDRMGTIKFIFDAEDSIDPMWSFTTTTTTTTTTTVPQVLLVVPDGDVTSQWATGGAGTGRWDRVNAGVDTPDDTNFIYGADSDVQRFTMTAPSYVGSCSRLRIRVRAYDSFGYNVVCEVFDGAVSMGNSDTGGLSGSYTDNNGDWINISKTAAELADLEIVLTGQNSSGETYISEIEVEIEL